MLFNEVIDIMLVTLLFYAFNIAIFTYIIFYLPLFCHMFSKL